MNLASKNLLIIGGLDPSGSAGVVKDIEVCHKLGLDAQVVVTTLTAQNQNQFLAKKDSPRSIIRRQLLLLEPAVAVKLGALANLNLATTIFNLLNKKQKHCWWVWDPVLKSSSGGDLFGNAKQLARALKKINHSQFLWTPNAVEAAALLNEKIANFNQAKKTCQELYNLFGHPVLLKGGHLPFEKSTQVYDFFCDGKKVKTFEFSLQKNPQRGTGCQLASAIACYLASGFPLEKSLVQAQEFLQKNWPKN